MRIIKGISSLIERRNVFAHASVDFSEKALQEFSERGNIIFKKLNNYETSERYNNEEANIVVGKFVRICKVLQFLINKGLPPEVLTSTPLSTSKRLLKNYIRHIVHLRVRLSAHLSNCFLTPKKPACHHLCVSSLRKN